MFALENQSECELLIMLLAGLQCSKRYQFNKAWWKRRSAEYGVRSTECGVRSTEYGVRSTECGVRSAESVSVKVFL